MMKRICSLFVLFVPAVVLALLWGCETTTADSDPATPEADASYASGVMDAATVPAVQPQEEPEDIIEDQRQKVGLRTDRVAALVNKFIEDGKALIEQNELEKAYEQFAHALELAPDNAEAQDLFNRVGSLLGKRDATIYDISSQASDRMVVRRAMNRMKAEELVNNAKLMMEQGDYDAAIRDLEDALLIVRWNPYLDREAIAESSILSNLDLARRKQQERELDRERQIQEQIYKKKQQQEQEEQEYKANLIKRLQIDANNAFLNDRYRHCELCLQELLKLDPDNEDAQELMTLAVRARHDQTKESTRKEYKRQWRKTFDDIEFMDVPVTDLLTFPTDDEWERISRRGRSELGRKKAALSPEDEQIHAKLESTPIPIQFEQTTLEEMVDYFKATTGVNFIISQEIIDSGEEPLFDLVTPPRPAAKQLELLMSMSLPPCKYTIQNGVVTIRLAEEPTGNYVLDVYDIRDLSKTIGNFPAKDFNLTPSNAITPYDEYEEEDDDAPDVIASDILVDLIRENIDPASWEDDVNNTITTIGNYLVVRQSPAVHDKINQLLTDLRNSAGILINIETRFLNVEDNFLQDVGVDWRGLDGSQDTANPLADVPNVLLDDFGDFGAGGFGDPSDPQGIGTGNTAGAYYDDGDDGQYSGRLENLLDLQLGEDGVLDNSGGSTLQFTYLDDVALSAILRAVEKSSQSNIIEAPSVTVYNGQRAHLTAITNTAYIKDFDPEVAQAAVIAEPIVDVIQEGVILDVKPVVSSDRRFVTMELRPTIAQLKRNADGEIPTFTTSLGVGDAVEIELPALEIKRLRTTVVIPDRSTLMLGGMKISNYQNFDTGLPFIRHIPIVGFFVSRKATYQSKRKLLILVKAHILIPEEDEPQIGFNK